MSEIASFSEVTQRLEAMSRVAEGLAKARETEAKARLANARAQGVEFQVAAAIRFLRKVEQETLRLRRRAKMARDQAKKLKQQWTSARVLFNGKKTQHYALRRANLEQVLLHVMTESSTDLFASEISSASRNGRESFISNDSSADDVPDVPTGVSSVPSLIQFFLEHRLVVKPLGPAMADISRMLQSVTDFHETERAKLESIASALDANAIDIWDDVPIFGRLSQDSEDV